MDSALDLLTVNPTTDESLKSHVDIERNNFAGLNPALKAVPEWEIRFKPYAAGNHRVFFDAAHLRRVLARYGAAAREVRMITHRKITQRPGTIHRHRVINGINSYIGKQTRLRIKDDEHSLIGELSFEYGINSTTYNNNPNPAKREESRRWILEMGHGYRLEIKQVKGPRNQEHYYYELECESFEAMALSPQKAAQAFDLIYDTVIPYTIDQWAVIQEEMATLFPEKFPYSLFANPRNLRQDDLTYYGLLGNPFTSYRVTHKADGERVLFIHNGFSLWAQRTPHRLTRLVTFEPEVAPREGYPITVFEAEYVAGEIDLYLVYDTLVNGGVTTTNLDHYTRLRFFEQWVAATNLADFLRDFRLEEKQFYDLGDPASFYRTIHQLHLERPTYPTDGLIFMPRDISYPHGDPLRESTLHSEPAICKWKPRHQLTIDFLVHDGQLHYQGGPRRQLVPFKGDKTWSWDPAGLRGRGVDSRGIIDRSMEGAVVEVAFPTPAQMEQYYSITDPEASAFLTRVRGDKLTANHPTTIFDNWRLIHRGIPLSTMLGEDLFLMRIYHNNIKRQILSSLPHHNNTLLDIGSGRGGDIGKWRGFSAVVAIEPSPEHIAELLQRWGDSAVVVSENPAIATVEPRDYQPPARLPPLTVIHAGAEDSALIRQVVGDHRFDMITAMLSLSLIQIDGTFLNIITQLLKRGGVFAYFSVDKRGVQSTLEDGQSLRGPWGAITRHGDELEIDLQGTIVEKQREYPPDTLQIDQRLLANGTFSHKEKWRADGERFLSHHEHLISRMYVYAELHTTQ